MKILSRSTWLCLALIFLSILRSIHLNYISRQPLKTSSSQYQHTSQPSLNTASLHAVPDKPNSIVDDTLLSDDPSNLFYFIQVSDLHISKFRTQTQHFLHFIQSVLPIVRPSFVVVTGDLTDAKGIDGVKTQQYKEEWQLYQNAIDQGIEDDLPWYDMRGNHDCFDLPSWQSNINLYRTFGKSSQLLEEGKGVYSWQMNQSYGQYQFIAMDACPKKGPARPLNFYGYMPTNSMDRLESTLLDESTYNHTFLFTHYPTTTMIFGQSSQGHTFKELMQHASVYLCGHLHRLAFGLGDILKSYDTTTKSLELELGDMKDHGVYRIMAVDDDLVSFVDVELPAKLLTSSTTHGDGIPLTENNTVIWPEKTRLAPIILITNPKDARFLLPGKEPIYRIRNSTHIRFLVFSDHDPHSLKVRIFVDNKHHPFPATYNKHTNSSLPLWTSSWSPEDFDDQITHSLGIQVTTPDGLVGESQVYFRVDGVQLKIGGGFGEWLIGTSVATLFKRLALFGLALIVLLLMGPKTYTDFIVIRQQQQQNSNHQIVTPSTQILLWLHALDVDPYAGPYQCIHQQSLAWLLRFFQFPLVMPYVFYTTLLFVLSFLCFPWFQADFIPSSNGYGTFYLWGIVFDGEWLPLGDTWMFATFHLCFDVGVFLILFAWRVTDVEDLHCSSTSEKHRQQWNQTLWFKVMEVLYWLWRMRSVMALGSFYGGLWPTLMMNLLVLWMLFVAGVLIWGKDGWIHKKNKTRIQMVLDGCDSCLDRSGPTRLDVNYEQQQQQEQQQVDSFNVSITSTSTMKNNPDDDWLEEQTSSESSSSSATTMDRNRIKVRRKGNGENNKR